jgi:hypothetical protein
MSIRRPDVEEAVREKTMEDGDAAWRALVAGILYIETGVAGASHPKELRFGELAEVNRGGLGAE